MSMTWDSPTDAKLLRGILKYAKLGQKGYQELADYMDTECTATAIRRRIEKLQEVGTKDASESSPPLTPNQSGKSSRGQTSALVSRTTIDGAVGPSTPTAKKRKVVAQDHSEDEDEDSTYGSPTKRLKAGKTEKIKLEPNNDAAEHYV